MPSIGRIQQLSVLGLAAAILGVSASSASANDVWLWSCHGPQGQPVGADFTAKGSGDADVVNYGLGCAGDVTEGGMQLRFSRQPAPGAAREAVTDPKGTSAATLEFKSPSGAPVSSVRVTRSTLGFTSATKAAGYTLDLDGAPRLEAAGADLTGDKTFTAAGSGGLTFTLSCNLLVTDQCTGGPNTVGVSRVGMLVSDTTPPIEGAVGRNSPVDKTMDISPQSSDVGVGLQRAEVTIDGSATPAATGLFGDCKELSPGDATVDLPLDADACPTVVKTTKMTVDTSALPEGDHRRVVTIFDAAGNSTVAIDETFSVTHPVPGSASQTLNIGTSGPTVVGGAPGGSNPAGTGGVLGASSQSCRTPKLSMFLNQKPLRVSKGVPVLKKSKSYRFSGRLTCVINGKRKSAPKRARVDILNTIGKKTTEKNGTTVAASGKLSVLLSYASSRLLTFRFTSADGQRSQVKIRIRVAKK